jgi:hypothetical protein
MKLAKGVDGGQPEQPGGPEGLQHPDRRSHCHGKILLSKKTTLDQTVYNNGK